jgi:hypothetical protein
MVMSGGATQTRSKAATNTTKTGGGGTAGDGANAYHESMLHNEAGACQKDRPSSKLTTKMKSVKRYFAWYFFGENLSRG